MISPCPSILSLIETDSTNACAFRLLKDSKPVEGTVIIAENQTQGRGMETNRWESAAGENLTFSMILYPGFLPVEKQFQLTQVISLGISDLVMEKSGAMAVTIKWPNDIYIDDNKVCGILIQNSIQGNHFEYVIAGIGLNVNQAMFPPSIPNPVSLKMATGQHFDLHEILQKLLQKLSSRYDQLRKGDAEGLRLEYLHRLYRNNAHHDYEIKGNRVKARITGISDFGQLMLMDVTGKEYICDLKEVKYL